MTVSPTVELLDTFQVRIRFSLDCNQMKEALKLLNLYYLGDEDCNKYDESFRLVPKYPDKETEQFKDAVRRVHMFFEECVTVALYSNGQLKIV